jgi:hypothetical protein
MLSSMVSTKRVGPEFTAREQALLDLLPTDGTPVTSAQLVSSYYGTDRPMNAHKIIIDRMRQIQKKIEFSVDADFSINKSKRSGPNPISFWLSPTQE